MFRNLFKKESRKRVLQDHSGKEISDTKSELGSELRAALYLYNNEKFIVCSIAGIAEYGEPIILDVTASDNDLGSAVLDKLLAFEVKGINRRPSGKLEDWSAFKASGAKTGKAFENKSMYIYVRTVNSAINIEAGPRVSLEKQLKTLCSISNGCSHSEAGSAIRKAIKAASLLREAGML